MKNIKVVWKQVTILVLGGIGILAVGAFGLFTLRDSLLEEHRAMAREQVSLGLRVLARYGEREASGELTRDDAQRRAVVIIRALGAGKPNYFWIMSRDTRFVMHGHMSELEGRTLHEVGDAGLTDTFTHFLGAIGRNSSGFVTHYSLRPDAEGIFEKISYYATYEPWNWIIGTGVYVDDVQRAFARLAWFMGGVAGAVFALVLLGSVLIGRSITVPLAQVAAGLRRLSAGDLDVRVPAVDRRDELGDVARAMSAFHDSLRERDRLMRALEESNRVLQESEARYRALTELSPVGVFQADAEGNCTYLNARGCEFAGLTAEQALGLGWGTALHPEDRDRVMAEWRHAIEHGEVASSEFRFLAPDGRVTWVFAQIAMVTDAGGRPAGYVGTLTDTTRYRQTEEMLRRSQRMEAVAQLTGGIAHDFNNLLGIILGQAELLKATAGGDAKELRYVDALMKAVRRGADLTRRLLGFSRRRPHETRRVAVNEFVRGMEGLIAKSLTPAIRVETILADDAWPVEIDPGDLEDAILNLALNARDAMPDGGDLVIETSNKVLDDAYVVQNPGGAAGEFLMVSVSDTGAGMMPEVRDKAFEPFFTTKEEGKGTGLGLSMVYGFVQRSGGHAKIYSEVGRGTVVRLYLPRARGTTEPVVAGETASVELPRGTETVLIVDDEALLVDSTAIFLEGLGYQTLTAATAEEGLAVLRAEPAVGLLFSDVIMPGGMDGYELALAALTERPDLKILLTSGFARRYEKVANGDARIASLAKSYLQKPYNLADLARAVRRVLDDGSRLAE